MKRPYSFLEANGYQEMPNPARLPIFLVRLKRAGSCERQPAGSAEEAARKFIKFAGIRSGKTIEVFNGDQDPDKDAPCFTFTTSVRPRMVRR
jgi:hypothetical protein